MPSPAVSEATSTKSYLHLALESVTPKRLLERLTTGWGRGPLHYSTYHIPERFRCWGHPLSASADETPPITLAGGEASSHEGLRGVGDQGLVQGRAP